jgi:hypothetical protein
MIIGIHQRYGERDTGCVEVNRKAFTFRLLLLTENQNVARFIDQWN